MFFELIPAYDEKKYFDGYNGNQEKNVISCEFMKPTLDNQLSGKYICFYYIIGMVTILNIKVLLNHIRSFPKAFVFLQTISISTKILNQEFCVSYFLNILSTTKLFFHKPQHFTICCLGKCWYTFEYINPLLIVPNMVYL